MTPRKIGQSPPLYIGVGEYRHLRLTLPFPSHPVLRLPSQSCLNAFSSTVTPRSTRYLSSVASASLRSFRRTHSHTVSSLILIFCSCIISLLYPIRLIRYKQTENNRRASRNSPRSVTGGACGGCTKPPSDLSSILKIPEVLPEPSNGTPLTHTQMQGVRAISKRILTP